MLLHRYFNLVTASLQTCTTMLATLWLSTGRSLCGWAKKKRREKSLRFPLWPDEVEPVVEQWKPASVHGMMDVALQASHSTFGRTVTVRVPAVENSDSEGKEILMQTWATSKLFQLVSCIYCSLPLLSQY